MEKFEKTLNENREFANMMDQEEEARKLHNTLISEAKNEGFAEGRAEGFAEGRVEGRAEGRAKAAIKIAKNMLNLNVDIKTISEYTDLTLEELEKLKKEL